jgi:ABC-2 type transport system permease protein
MTPQELLRPYRAAFASRFLQMLQYRTAAYAGFATQCWWGGIKVMVLAAFYAGAAADAPMSLAQAITYTWLAQGLLALLPWSGDPEVAQAVRVLPRAALMAAFAGLALPLMGLHDWAWQPPAGVAAGLGFAASALLALLLSTSLVMLLNIAAAAALNERGINALAVPAVIVLSGNLLPLALLPDAWQTALLLQPLAGVMDIPARIYFGQLAGAQALAGLGLQCGWTLLLVALGRAAMRRTLRRLEVQGG